MTRGPFGIWGGCVTHTVHVHPIPLSGPRPIPGVPGGRQGEEPGSVSTSHYPDTERDLKIRLLTPKSGPELRNPSRSTGDKGIDIPHLPLSLMVGM